MMQSWQTFVQLVIEEETLKMGRKRKLELDDIRDKDKLDIKRESLEVKRDIIDREKYARNLMNNAAKDKIYVDPSTVPEGMTYCWIRLSIHNEPDVGRESMMLRSGWDPVPASRHPDLVINDYLGRGMNSRGYILNTGLMLCEKPTVYIEEDMKYYNRENERIMSSVPELDNLMKIPNVITQFENKNTYNYMSNQPLTHGIQGGNNDFGI